MRTPRYTELPDLDSPGWRACLEYAPILKAMIDREFAEREKLGLTSSDDFPYSAKYRRGRTTAAKCWCGEDHS